jgi:two-component system, NtrC family, response regulator HydG
MAAFVESSGYNLQTIRRYSNMEQRGDFCLSLGECYETIIETMAEGVFVVDQTGTIVFTNNAMERFTGYSADELLGKRCHAFMECRCEADSGCALFSARELTRKECRIKHRDGRLIPVLRSARLKHDDQKKVKGVIETVTDISELKAVKRNLAILEQKDRARVQFHRMIGKSPAMREVFDLIQMAGSSNASILITGESGTGKELVAEMIHAESQRVKKPLVKVNCSALSENLLESELFGHVKGAFTGAIKNKTGRFEAAHQGSLFLDEISEVSPLIQLKVLRFLQEKEFERVGDHQTIKADVRILSATNRDLRVLIEEGLFREDLYYRLKVFPINLPPLRERKEDVPLLIDHFVTRFNSETGKGISGVTGAAAAALLDYHWPGNVRELENAIEHAFVVRQEGEILPVDLPVEIRYPEKNGLRIRTGDGQSPPVPFTQRPVVTSTALL